MNLLEALPDELQELIKFYNPHPLAEMLKQDLELFTLDIRTEQNVIGILRIPWRHVAYPERYVAVTDDPDILAARELLSLVEYDDGNYSWSDCPKIKKMIEQERYMCEYWMDQ